MSPTAARGAGILGVAGLLFAAWWGWAGTRPESLGPGWASGPPPVELATAALAGPLRSLPWGVELRGLQAAQAPEPLMVGDSVRITATVPDGGSLMVRAGRSGGIAAPSGAPPGRGPMPPPGGGGPPGGAHPGGRPPGGAAAQGSGDGILFDRGPAASVRGVGGFRCAPLALPSGEVTATLRVTDAGVEVATPSGSTTCTGGRLAGPWVLRPGVERVRVRSVEYLGPKAPRASSGGVPITQGAAAAVAAWLLGAALGAALGRRVPGLGVLAPMALAPLVALVPAERWLESVRLLSFPEALVPLVFPGLVTLTLTVGALARAFPLRVALAASALPAVALLACSLRYPDAPGWALVAGALVPWAGLVYANSRHVRAVGLWSWGALAAMGLLVEGGLRHTAVNDTWVHTSGYGRAATEFRELLELKKYRDYPSDGFPVKPPESRPGVRRIVALGGSSTGGAYQMDDINLFWPRALETAIGDPAWEVVNQGVGGWNTLHIRLYVESQLERLAPDILVLYVGHNDIFSTGVATHKALLAQYQAPPNAVVTRTLAGLRAFRSYVGFSFLLKSWRGEAAVAVPLPDARENLELILGLAEKRNTHVLLLTEGLNPDPAPMRPYAALMEEVAAEHGARALDAAARFVETGDPDDFLDDCHLTVQGHQRLAGWVLDDLRTAGWL